MHSKSSALKSIVAANRKRITATILSWRSMSAKVLTIRPQAHILKLRILMDRTLQSKAKTSSSYSYIPITSRLRVIKTLHNYRKPRKPAHANRLRCLLTSLCLKPVKPPTGVIKTRKVEIHKRKWMASIIGRQL